MTSERIRIVMAEALGWSRIEKGWLPTGRAHPLFSEPSINGTPPEDKDKPHNDQRFELVPDFPNDLNACHKAENTLTPEEIGRYEQNLYAVTHKSIPVISALFWSQHHFFTAFHASGPERCEAFILTRCPEKWENI